MLPGGKSLCTLIETIDNIYSPYNTPLERKRINITALDFSYPDFIGFESDGSVSTKLFSFY